MLNVVLPIRTWPENRRPPSLVSLPTAGLSSAPSTLTSPFARSISQLVLPMVKRPPPLIVMTAILSLTVRATLVPSGVVPFQSPRTSPLPAPKPILSRKNQPPPPTPPQTQHSASAPPAASRRII